MVKDIDYYRSIHNATGCNTRKDMEISVIHKRLERDFYKSLDIETFVNFITNDSINLNINKQSRSDVSGYQKDFTSLITAPIQHGDTFYNEKEKTYWICTEVMCKSGLYYDGKLTRCNNILKWQDDNGKVFEYPVFDVNSTQYNSGVRSDKTIMLGSTQHMLTIIADENTIALEHDKRFFFDRNTKSPTVFKLTQNDTTALNYDRGLLHLTVTEDQYNPKTDNIDLMICDYFEIELSETSSPIEITYVGNPTVRIGGSKTFRVKETAVTFTMSIADMFKDMVSFKQVDDFSCKVSVKNNEMAVGANLKIIAISKNGDKGELLINIVGGV